MQSKRQIMGKVRSMLADVRCEIIEECERLASSGGVDLEAAEDDFRLPKVILTAAMRNVATHRRPLHAEGKEQLKNLENV